MNVKVYNLDGSEKGDIELPAVFETEYRPDLIKRAVISSLTAKLQPKGCDRNNFVQHTLYEVIRVIEPAETRGMLIHALLLCENKEEVKSDRKHGIPPF